MNNTLIADSGSTKTLWAVGTKRVGTQGINPVHQDDDTILAILRNELLPQLSTLNPQLSTLNPHPSPLTSIRFYGSGVGSDQEQRMECLLRTVFPDVAHVEARSDMLGAARALCGRSEGQACILGTGANSCIYDGERIVQNTPALGYILGDEGSGAVLGRLFVNALYKNGLYQNAKEEFEASFHMTMADVISRVYRQPMANRWLASLAPYIGQHIDQPAVASLVEDNFRSFITHNLVPYNRRDLPITAVGSIAYHFREQLQQAAAAEGYALGTVLQNPVDALVAME